MGIEIERKFRVIGDGWRAAAHAVIDIAQGYLNDRAALASGAQHASVRIRLQGDAAYLNIKSSQPGHTRQEFEYPLPVKDARELLALCVGGRIEKRRHLINHGGLLWEVDEFLGDNAGLVVAEVELHNAGQTIEKPEWLGAEVTDDLRYYNLALSWHPYSQWEHSE